MKFNKPNNSWRTNRHKLINLISTCNPTAPVGAHLTFCKIMISTAQEFLALMRSEDPADYHRLRHDSAPIEVWRELITKYSLANEWVARNKTSPVEILREIASDSRVVVRAEVAMTRRITEDIQEQLARDADSSVRNTLANNSKATDRILALLAQDSEAFVRETASRRIKERQAEQAGAGQEIHPPKTT